MDVITSSDPVDLSPLTPIQLLDDSFTADAELLLITYWLVPIDCWHMATVTAQNWMFQMTLKWEKGFNLGQWISNTERDLSQQDPPAAATPIPRAEHSAEHSALAGVNAE
jgi:hypothetical protein